VGAVSYERGTSVEQCALTSEMLAVTVFAKTVDFFIVALLSRSSFASRPSSGSSGPVVPSFRALSGRFKFTARRHNLNKDSHAFQKAFQHPLPVHPTTPQRM